MTFLEHLTVEKFVENADFIFATPHGSRFVCEDNQKVEWVVKMFQLAEGNKHDVLDVVFMKEREGSFEREESVKATFQLGEMKELYSLELPTNGYYKVTRSRKNVVMESIDVDNPDVILVTPKGEIIKMDPYDFDEDKAVQEYQKAEGSDDKVVKLRFINKGKPTKIISELKLGEKKALADLDIPTNGYHEAQGEGGTLPIEPKNFSGELENEDIWIYTSKGSRGKFSVDTEAKKAIEFIQLADGTIDNIMLLSFHWKKENSEGFVKKAEFEIALDENKTFLDLEFPVNGHFVVEKTWTRK